MPFPILRTPLVVLSEIISLLEPNEIVTASFCSKNVKRLLKYHYQRRKPLGWRLFLIQYEDCRHWISIETPEDGKRIEVLSAEHISKLKKPIPASLATNEFITEYKLGYVDLYYEDQVMGSKTILDYVTDLFNLDIYGLEIDRYGTWVLDWINERKEKMLISFEFNETAHSGNNSYGDEALDYVLRNLPASDSYILDEFVSEKFRSDGKLGPANHLLIDSYGHWVTLENLMNFDFIKIVINESRLSVSDVYSFLRHWRTGGSPRLTFLRLEFESQRIFENFEDMLGVVETEISGEYRFDGENRHFDHGYSIQRNDGVKAVLDFGEEHFVMMVCIGENVYDRINYRKKNSDQQFLLHQVV
ncbi:hypothetical protein B9Z55_015181 [Caenorhabditis nigoni]|uniref:F-box domain-containing protein n=1 Tax=Caenorhabditis nigoni TaxID=1611254 RepID=A0A2G5U936_9PELO|nr:hypothetical protein B9Z55_015181 [Caenorhabditis nigoni]